MEQKRKTIFITSFHGLVSRTLLGGVLDRLLEGGAHIVLFVPEYKERYFRDILKAHQAVTVVGIGMERLSAWAYRLHRLSFLLLHTKTTQIIRRSLRGYYKKPHKYLSADALSWSVGKRRHGRALFRRINDSLHRAPIFEEYFNAYAPSLVFSTDSKHMLDTALLIEAQRRGIVTASMVRSWDYLTAKGLIRVRPDALFVHNDIIKKEAVDYADMDERRVITVGLPHLDCYSNHPRSSREAFFRRIGVRPEKRLIFLAPFGEKFSDVDRDFFSLLSDAIKTGRLPADCEVLVRLPPGDTVLNDAELSYPHLVFDYPGVRFSGMHRKANEMSIDDMLHLADSLYWSDVVLTGPSTIAIDAAALDKPTIFLGFDGNQKRPYYRSVRHYYDFLHMQNVVKTGGVRFAHSADELFTHVHGYLTNPEKEREGRKCIVREQCGALDGKASKRLADSICNLL